MIIPEHEESGRAWLSKGLVREAKKIANKNIELLKHIITAETPLIGIEPSAILTFRDEYIDLADDDQFEAAKELAKHVFMIDEFIASEIEKGNISKEQFTQEKRELSNCMDIASKKHCPRGTFCKNFITSGKLFSGNDSFRLLRNGRFFWL